MSRFISILVASSLSLVTLAASPGCGSDDAPSCASLVTHTADPAFLLSRPAPERLAKLRVCLLQDTGDARPFFAT